MLTATVDIGLVLVRLVVATRRRGALLIDAAMARTIVGHEAAQFVLTWSARAAAIHIGFTRTRPPVVAGRLNTALIAANPAFAVARSVARIKVSARLAVATTVLISFGPVSLPILAGRLGAMPIIAADEALAVLAVPAGLASEAQVGRAAFTAIER